MISHISIKDFAIIDRINVDLHQGLNIITGETGAGKSIIIEAVSLALGSRADSAYVRSGKDKAVIQLIADVDGEDIVITREVSANGKSLCKVNDELVSLSHLNKLCKRIADIHGQYDHQSLLNPENHIKLVDSYDNQAIAPVKEFVSELYSNYAKEKAELQSLIKNQADQERKKDFMRFELNEIQSANPYIGEDEELSQKILLLQNSEKIYGNLSEAYQILYEETPSAIEGLGKSLHLLQSISAYSDQISSIENNLSEAYYRLEDISTEIRKYKESITFSPEELDEALSRLNTLDTLKRKYGGSIDKILLYRDRIAEELDKIENVEQIKEKLAQNLSILKDKLQKSSDELTGLRKKSAEAIEKKINKELQELNFKDACLIIHFTDPEKGSEPTFTEDGIDKVEFLITTNKGEKPKPLAKIASGGEISRIMLAFKQIIGDYDAIPTMIFDEIDSGISGITASIVGKKLLTIAEKHQIICITHLPQIAAYGQHHYKIEKETNGDKTHTTIIPLDQDEKIKEIARLLGGINITDTTLKSAEELLSLSN